MIEKNWIKEERGRRQGNCKGEWGHPWSLWRSREGGGTSGKWDLERLHGEGPQTAPTWLDPAEDRKTDLLKCSSSSYMLACHTSELNQKLENQRPGRVERAWRCRLPALTHWLLKSLGFSCP